MSVRVLSIYIRTHAHTLHTYIYAVFRQSSLFSSLAQNQIKMHGTQYNHICTSYFFICVEKRVLFELVELVSDIHRDKRASETRKMLVDMYASKTMMCTIPSISPFMNYTAAAVAVAATRSVK